MNPLMALPTLVTGAVFSLLGADRRREARRRAHRCLQVADRPERWARIRRFARAGALPAAPDWVVPPLIGLGAVALIGGPTGFLVGAVLTIVARRRMPRLRSPTSRRRAREHDLLIRQLPLAADLLVACMGSCSSPARAAAAVAESVDAPMSEWLAGVAAQLSLGAPPESCWEQLGTDCPLLAPLARCLVRTTTSGAPVAAALGGLAQSQRAAAGRAAHARVRRAGVLATAPLGVCFLPAFVLIGVTPVVMGLTTLSTRHI